MRAKRFLQVSKTGLALVAGLFSFLVSAYTSARDSEQMKKNISVVKLDAAEAVSKHNEAVVVITRFDVKQGYLQQFRNALSNYVTKALVNENNIMAEAYYEQENPSILWVIERWNNKTGQLAFFNSSPFRSVTSLAEEALLKPAQTTYVKDLEPLSKTEWRKVAARKDKPLTIMLFVDAKSGTENKFKDVYHIAMPQFRSEPGVINYQLSQFEDDSTRFVTYEKFRNEEAFQYHLKFPPIQPVIDYLNTDIKQQPFQAGLHRLIEFSSVHAQ